ncbi:maleylacetoacetate isomerase [Defluviimonas sp. 20V17]|uniref:Maleylacetoacetate isomerase n=1 Tax=Allgaiera indica TaxID=765699 RepID=A0AAN4UV86_9RHOB|nr:maleylacetoacetate isomerase [Allgaiera indica]KDB04217.1 maleylacetoacetate isomerase [Defluviimonas sp. 20V17]GHE06482.1 maleylacetoacetate isomerase [Allgaiera indica]SDX94066.1 maleylacetoacetate isomerase [Allgaiera indica]
MKLYGYWRSGAAYRLRIAFGLKGLDWEDMPVNLLAGDQQSEAFRSLNPIGLVPVLELDDGAALSQSLAILDWLDRSHPEPPLFPENPVARARVMAAGMTIAVDTHPLQNVGVVKHLKSAYGVDQQGGVDWMIHWMDRGFAAFQKMCEPNAPFAFGEEPSFADICLIPQLYNAHRWEMDLSSYPRLTEIEARCLALPAFEAARPENRPDAA